MRGPLIILSGPGGSGKSTVVARLLATTPELPLRRSVSATTRLPRPGERDDVDYHFWDVGRFQHALAAGEFLEHALVHGNYYGTLRCEVEKDRADGVGIILTIDVQGGDKVRQQCPDAVRVFLKASSETTYEERLRQRNETEDSIRRRLAAAQAELARATDYDYVIVNDDLDHAVNQFRAIIQRTFGR